MATQTTDNVQKYFELMAAQRDARGRSDDAEATRLYWEADTLTSHLIRANLESLGVKDVIVTGVLYYSANQITSSELQFRDGDEAGRIEMLLSDLCGLRYGRVGKRLGVGPEGLSFWIRIEKDGARIGSVDSDGRFDYTAAPDFRTALGWQIATDGGRVRIVESFNLDEASILLLYAIRDAGTSREAFFGPYFKELQRVFKSGHTSRFGDGYCGAATNLWQVATRELGEEHPGYSFSY